VPRWLGDEDVRKGIVVMLETRRCKEEIERLKAEAKAMNSWLEEEVNLTSAALARCSGESLLCLWLDPALGGRHCATPQASVSVLTRQPRWLWIPAVAVAREGSWISALLATLARVSGVFEVFEC
jgi:hypothetical protein